MLKGALAGAIGGMFGVGGDLVMAVAGGAVGALVTDGDPMMGALSAGIAAGVGACFGKTPLPGVLGRAVKGIGNAHLRNLMFSAASGALCGGVTAEIFGGDFGQGAMWGAAGAAAAFALTALLVQFHRNMRSPADPSDIDVIRGIIEGWGDPQHDAAGQALWDLYGSSYYDGVEYGNVLFHNEETGEYWWPEIAVKGEIDRVLPQKVWGAAKAALKSNFGSTASLWKPVAFLHSHPKWGYYTVRGRERFLYPFGLSSGDIDVARDYKLDMYAMTHHLSLSGRIYHYSYLGNSNAGRLPSYYFAGYPLKRD